VPRSIRDQCLNAALAAVGTIENYVGFEPVVYHTLAQLAVLMPGAPGLDFETWGMQKHQSEKFYS
jgi:hypothetical protein